jgi:hypothetical protein
MKARYLRPLVLAALEGVLPPQLNHIKLPGSSHIRRIRIFFKPRNSNLMPDNHFDARNKDYSRRKTPVSVGPGAGISRFGSSDTWSGPIGKTLPAGSEVSSWRHKFGAPVRGAQTLSLLVFSKRCHKI